MPLYLCKQITKRVFLSMGEDAELRKVRLMHQFIIMVLKRR